MMPPFHAIFACAENLKKAQDQILSKENEIKNLAERLVDVKIKVIYIRFALQITAFLIIFATFRRSSWTKPNSS